MNAHTRPQELLDLIQMGRDVGPTIHDLMKIASAMKGQADEYVVRMLHPDGDGGEAITPAEAREFKYLSAHIQQVMNFAVHLAEEAAREYSEGCKPQAVNGRDKAVRIAT